MALTLSFSISKIGKHKRNAKKVFKKTLFPNLQILYKLGINKLNKYLCNNKPYGFKNTADIGSVGQ